MDPQGGGEDDGRRRVPSDDMELVTTALESI